MSNELIARLEAATADHQRELLQEAFEVVHPYPGHEHYLVDEIDWTWDRLRRRFAAMILAEAYESAALTLVPEGWGFMSLGADPYEQDAFCVTVYDRRHWNRHREWPEGSITTGYSFATPALAIVIAALRAKDTTHD